MLVVDASVLAVALGDDGADGHQARRRLRGEQLAAPEIVDLAIDDLTDLPVHRTSHPALLRRCWELRDDLTPYDACYVALAEALDCALLTADRRLATAPGPRCPIEVFRPVSRRAPPGPGD